MLAQVKYLAVVGVVAAVAAPQAPRLIEQWKQTRATPVAASASPAQPLPRASAGFGAVDLPPEQGGHYFAPVEIEGTRLRMMVDTGATVVALSADDAEKIGLRPMPADFSVPVQTANGVAYAARARLREARIGTIALRDVDALVLPRAVASQSLLGMSFLKRLSGFGYEAGRLVLRQ